MRCDVRVMDGDAFAAGEAKTEGFAKAAALFVVLAKDQ